MTDAPDPRDERDGQDGQADQDRPGRARRSGTPGGSSGKSDGRTRKGSGPGAGASRGGDPGRPGRTSGGGRRRSAPASRAPDPDADGRVEPTGPSDTDADPTPRAARRRRDQPAEPRAAGTSDDHTDSAHPTPPAARGRRGGPGAGTAGNDPAEAYLAAYLDAVERGDDPPDLAELDAGARSDVEAVLALLAGNGDGDEARTGASGGRNPHADTDGETGDRSGGEPDLRPLGESEFAIEHGLSRTNPDVVVAGPAVRRARSVTGMTPVDVAEEMARRGYAIAAEAVEALEQRTAHRMHPRDARLLAAVLDLPLDTIEAVAAPWSADPAALAELAGAAATDTDDTDAPTVTPIVLGDDVVLRTGTGSHLGVLRCAGGADVLDSRTYRQAAASRLVGPWSHLAGALLVADEGPHLALAVDALDCVARQHAPSGLIGFSRLAEPETIAAALASYDRAYAIDWSDPDPLEGLATRPDQATRALAGRIEALAERLADEARRSRQTGKRPGYAAAARWLRSTPATDVVALLDELAQADPDAARRRIDELTEVVLA